MSDFQIPRLLQAAVLVAGLSMWWLITGSYGRVEFLIQDLSAVAAVLALWGLGSILWKRRRLHSLTGAAGTNQRLSRKSKTLVISLLILFSSWIGVSLVDNAVPSSLPRDFGRFDPARRETSILEIDETDDWRTHRVGVSLSGGGYRAAVFHAGVLHALERLGVPITNLSTVSGGSIIGGYYFAGGDPLDFQAAVAAGHFNLRRRLLMFHNLVRLPFPVFDRLDVQAEEISRQLLGGVMPHERQHDQQPRLMIAATDLTYGFAVGMLSDGVFLLSKHMHRFYRNGSTIEPVTTDLGRRIAVSGAFPGAFPTTQLEIEIAPSLEPSRRVHRTFILSDGGVYDNTGYRLLEAIGRFSFDPDSELDTGGRRRLVDSGSRLDSDWRVRAILVSDASAVFGIDRDISGLAVFPRLFDIGPPAEPVPSERDRSLRPLRFSPRARFINAGLVFRANYEIDELFRQGKEFHDLPFDPHGLPSILLDELVALTPGETRHRMKQLLEEFLAKSEFHRDQAPGFTPRERPPYAPVSRFRSAEECLRRRDDPTGRIGPSTCEAVALRLAINAEVEDCVRAFAGISTLDDQLSRAEVDRLFRLGQYTVFLSWRSLVARLN